MDERFTLKQALVDLEATHKLAVTIGSRLKGGELIELSSDIGGGKTTFTKGMAEGAGSLDHVSSPSFTLRNDYQAKDIAIAHFDFYRLSDPGIVKEMLAEAISDLATCVVIEWAGVVDDILPPKTIKIEIKAIGENSRDIMINYSKRFAYLFTDLSND